MSISKQRRKPAVKRRKPVNSGNLESTITRIRIRRHKFPEVQKDPDFIALIKVGRVVNAVVFGFQCISDYMNDMSPVGRRQYNRAVFLTAGYLFEGLELVTSLRPKYINEPYFKRLEDLTLDPYKRHRKILQEIRHSVAFHLDSHDKSTKTTLARLKLPRYDLMSGNSSRMMDIYFDFADIIDLNYLVDKFKDSRPEDEILLEIFSAITDLMKEFGGAGHEFVSGLAAKMNFFEYVD